MRPYHAWVLALRERTLAPDSPMVGWWPRMGRIPFASASRMPMIIPENVLDLPGSLFEGERASPALARAGQ
jgi:hypothetical protein